MYLANESRMLAFLKIRHSCHEKNICHEKVRKQENVNNSEILVLRGIERIQSD